MYELKKRKVIRDSEKNKKLNKTKFRNMSHWKILPNIYKIRDKIWILIKKKKLY